MTHNNKSDFLSKFETITMEDHICKVHLNKYCRHVHDYIFIMNIIMYQSDYGCYADDV